MKIEFVAIGQSNAKTAVELHKLYVQWKRHFFKSPHIKTDNGEKVKLKMELLLTEE